MYSPVTRLLTVLELLQARPSITAAQLAQRLEVNSRSARRYITMLQDLGMPIEAGRGRYGGYRLRPGYKLPPLMLTEDEALAVTLGLLAARQLGLSGTVPAVEGALAKVERVLPIAVRERVQAVQENVTLDLNIQKGLPATDWLKTFSTAAQETRRLTLRYQAGSGEQTRRVFDCYGVLYRNGRWYAVGYCHLRQEIRVFRLDRVLEAELSDERFVRPTDFDSRTAVVGIIATIPDTWHVQALLETTLEDIQALVPPEYAKLEERADGVLLRAYERDLDHAARFLVGLGCPLRVQQPEELLEALKRLAQTIMQTVSEGITPL
ncbi:MAG TPA: YafY family protein [Ktedonobacterales bacterium]|jgi:predicted DNA-binding transcriptional regulator YafY